MFRGSGNRLVEKLGQRNWLYSVVLRILVFLFSPNELYSKMVGVLEYYKYSVLVRSNTEKIMYQNNAPGITVLV